MNRKTSMSCLEERQCRGSWKYKTKATKEYHTRCSYRLNEQHWLQLALERKTGGMKCHFTVKSLPVSEPVVPAQHAEKVQFWHRGKSHRAGTGFRALPRGNSGWHHNPYQPVGSSGQQQGRKPTHPLLATGLPSRTPLFQV